MFHLTVGTFTAKQLHKIQLPLIQLLLSKLGFNANMPKEVIYGPMAAGGIGFIPLVVIQVQQKIKQILQAYRHHTELHHLFTITFHWAQKVAGISVNIFYDTATEILALQHNFFRRVPGIFTIPLKHDYANTDFSYDCYGTSAMSEWAHVTSKKKPPSVATESPVHELPPKEVSFASSSTICI